MREELGRRLEAVDAPLTESDVEHLWRGANARRRMRKTRRRVLIAGAGALVALFVVGGLSLSSRRTALRLEDGSVATEARSELDGHALRFDDGSVVAVERGTRITVLSSLPEGIRFELSEGRAAFDVVPGGGRSWEIRCGVAEVRVLGTAFVLRREGATLHVEVLRGRVGVTAPGTHRELGAGEVLRVEHAYPEAPAIAPSETGPAETNETERSETNETEPSAAEHSVEPSSRGRVETSGRLGREASDEVARPPSSWRALANEHAWAEAYDSLGPEGVRALVPDASVEDLFLLADVCRSSRHPAEAVRALDRIVEEHPDEPGAALAAYTLGTLEMDRLHHPDRAARAFSRALSLGLPSGMVADAEARRAQAEGLADEPE